MESSAIESERSDLGNWLVISSGVSELESVGLLELSLVAASSDVKALSGAEVPR